MLVIFSENFKRILAQKMKEKNVTTSQNESHDDYVQCIVKNLMMD